MRLISFYETNEPVIMTPATGLLARVLTEKGTLLGINRQLSERRNVANMGV